MQLQQHSERKQIWQQGIQGTALFITMIILIVGMLYELQNNVIVPLEELGSVAERFRGGIFLLASAIALTMSLVRWQSASMPRNSALEQSHHTLESRVAQKTESLARAYDALELLYNSSRDLATNQVHAKQLDQLIERFQTLLPGLHA